MTDFSSDETEALDRNDVSAEYGQEQEEVSDGTYWIPEENLPRLQETVKKLQRRALKVGAAVLELVSLGHEDRPILDKFKKPTGVARRWFHVELKGDRPQLAGWTFVATLQHLEVDGETQNLLRTAPTFKGELPTEYRTAKARNCDHCHQERNRKETFVLLRDDGTFAQIGRNCLQDFLGGVDPRAIASYLERLFQAASECEKESQGGEGGSDNRFDQHLFVAHVVANLRSCAWLSRTKARQLESPATADLALNVFLAKGEARSRIDPKFFATEEDRKLAREILDWAQDFLTPEKGEGNDYLYNLRVALAQGPYIEWKLSGLTASVVPMFARETERLALESVEIRKTENSKHIGAVKDRVLLNVQVQKVIDIESADWGVTHLHKLVTQDGNAVVWFSTSEKLTAGATLDVVGTVKKHDIREGVKQTILTRVVVVDEAGIVQFKKKEAAAAKKAAKASVPVAGD